MKKRISFPVAFLTAVLILSGCSSVGKQEAGNKEVTEQGASSAITEAASADPYDRLEGLDYEGYRFRFCYYGTEANGWNPYIDVAESNGEVLNDAAFDRNAKVSELLNVSFSMIRDPAYETLFKNSIYAGDEEYDMALFWTDLNGATYMTEHLLFDWNDLPLVDLEADWYNQSANEAFSVAGTQFFGVSDMTFTVQQHFRFLYNKQLAEDNGLKSVYDDVLSGTFTFDKMLADIRKCYKDLNGNGEADDADCFGFATNAPHTNLFFRNTGGPEVTVGPDGYEINIYSERIVTLVEKVVGLLQEKACFDTTQGNAHYNVFNEGRALFAPYSSDPVLLRDYDVDFGYVPYPKLTEDQPYYTTTTGGFMGLPVSLSDPARTGAIIEATSIASHELVIEAFISAYIEGKILRDKESVDIYRMMRSSAVYDISYNTDPSGKLRTISAYYKHFLDTKSTDVASWYAAEGPGIKEKYDELWKLASAKKE
ncbi:MAG: hypothetical protein J5938_00600 [Clostridia bacterium]|nr:hypothetical protein [Clostridia bacterium]